MAERLSVSLPNYDFVSSSDSNNSFTLQPVIGGATFYELGAAGIRLDFEWRHISTDSESLRLQPTLSWGGWLRIGQGTNHGPGRYALDVKVVDADTQEVLRVMSLPQYVLVRSSSEVLLKIFPAIDIARAVRPKKMRTFVLAGDAPQAVDDIGIELSLGDIASESGFQLEEITYDFYVYEVIDGVTDQLNFIDRAYGQKLADLVNPKRLDLSVSMRNKVKRKKNNEYIVGVQLRGRGLVLGEPIEKKVFIEIEEALVAQSSAHLFQRLEFKYNTQLERIELHPNLEPIAGDTVDMFTGNFNALSRYLNNNFVTSVYVYKRNDENKNMIRSIVDINPFVMHQHHFPIAPDEAVAIEIVNIFDSFYRYTQVLSLP